MKTGRKVGNLFRIKRLSNDGRGKGKKNNENNTEIVVKPNDDAISLTFQVSEKEENTKEDSYEGRSDTTLSLSDDNQEMNEIFSNEVDPNRGNMIQELMMRLNIKMKKTLETMESVHTQEIYEISKIFDEAMIREDIESEKEVKKLKEYILLKSNKRSRADNPVKYMDKLIEQNSLLKLENARLEWKLRRCAKKTAAVNSANRLTAISFEKFRNEIMGTDSCSVSTSLKSEDFSASEFSFSIRESMKYIDESKPIGSVKEVVKELENERK